MTRSFPQRLHWLVLRGCLGLGALIGLAGIPLLLVQGLRGGALSWSVDLRAVTEMPRQLFVPSPGTSATYPGQVNLLLTHPDRPLSFLAVLPDLLLDMAMAYVCFVLLLLVLRIQEGRTFAGNGPRLLRGVAAVVALAGMLVPVTRAWADDRILRHAGRLGQALGGGPAEGGWDVNVSLIWLIVAAVVLAVARAWAEGQRLAQDSEGLV